MNQVMEIIILILFIVGFPYIILGIMAYSHTILDENNLKMSAASPWWALDCSKYNEIGKKYCFYGKILLFIDISGALIYFLLAML